MQSASSMNKSMTLLSSLLAIFILHSQQIESDVRSEEENQSKKIIRTDPTTMNNVQWNETYKENAPKICARRREKFILTKEML